MSSSQTVSRAASVPAPSVQEDAVYRKVTARLNSRTDVAMYVLAVVMVVGALLILRIPAKLVNR